MGVLAGQKNFPFDVVLLRPLATTMRATEHKKEGALADLLLVDSGSGSVGHHARNRVDDPPGQVPWQGAVIPFIESYVARRFVGQDVLGEVRVLSPCMGQIECGNVSCFACLKAGRGGAHRRMHDQIS